MQGRSQKANTILVVEDNQDMLADILTRVAELGYSIRSSKIFV